MGAAYFSASYEEARLRFRNAAEAQGFTLFSEPIDAPPPERIGLTPQPLSIDVAARGPEEAAECLVFSSGLHGVEGFFGSAVQLALLFEPSLLKALEGLPGQGGRRLVLIHALNPFGMAYGRRWNENGVDLNRNFLGEGEAYAGAPPEYDTLDPLLNPMSPPPLIDLFPLLALKAIARHRYLTLKIALSTGQYEHPDGLWFGGAGPERLRGVLEEKLDGWIGAAPRLTWFDLHTGLGHWGERWLFVNAGLSAGRLEDLQRRHGDKSVVTVFDGVKAMPNKGLMRDWLARRYADRNPAILTAEFGTYAPLKVLQALRAENRAWRCAKTPAAHRPWAERLREIFAPRSPAWRDLAVSKALTLARAGL